MEPDQVPVAPKYKKPPVIERVVTVIGDLAEQTFYAKFEEWKEIVLQHFTEYDPIKEWKLNIEMKDDVPLLSDALPEVQITHRFWKLSDKGKRFMSMRILPNQFTLNLHREQENPHHFEELYFTLEQWLPRWIAHFEIKGCSHVALDYINLLSRPTTPQFIKNDGSIQLNDALAVFTGIPGRHLSIIPPYDCQMGLLIDPKRLAAFNIRIQGLNLPKFGNAVRVDFQAIVTKDAPCLAANQVFAEIDFLHKLILEYFESVFTKEARRSFEPT